MDYSKNIPEYLVDKRNTTKLILFTAAFALIFINTYKPFNSVEWVPNLSEYEYLGLSTVLILFGLLVVTISRIILYKYCKRTGHTIKLSTYLWWIAAELFSMSAAFVLFEKLAFNDGRNVVELFKISTINTALVLLLPYSVLWLYFSWSDKNQKLKTINTQQASDASSTVKQSMINFYDAKGDVKFSVKSPDLIYIKGADNYITIYYRDGSKLSSIMIRYSMKQVEDELKPRGIVRCHRSYIVNTMHVKMFERTREGIVIKLEAPIEVAVPVSKSYVKEVFELFG